MKQKAVELIKLSLLVMFLILTPYFFVQTFNGISEYRERKDVQLLNLSLVTANENLCFKIKNVDFKNGCFLESAEAKRDSSLCNHITEQEQRRSDFIVEWIHPYKKQPQMLTNLKDDCRAKVQILIINDALNSGNYLDCKENQDCLYQLAIKLNDWNYCNNLREKQDSCLLEIAKSTKENTHCKRISTTIIREDCYYFFSTILFEPELCELISLEKKKDCYYAVALNQSEAAYCDKTVEKEGECYFIIAQKLGLSSLCTRAQVLESECWKFFALTHSNEEFCALSSNSSFCYYELAFQVNKLELCWKAGKSKNLCFYIFALRNGQPALCLNIDDNEKICPEELPPYPERYLCYSFSDTRSSCVYFSSKTNSIYCDKISEKTYYKYRCYRNVAIENSDVKLCEKAQDFKENCYFEIALKERKIEFCSKAGPWQSECYSKLQNGT